MTDQKRVILLFQQPCCKVSLTKLCLCNQNKIKVVALKITNNINVLIKVRREPV